MVRNPEAYYLAMGKFPLHKRIIRTAQKPSEK